MFKKIRLSFMSIFQMKMHRWNTQMKDYLMLFLEFLAGLIVICKF